MPTDTTAKLNLPLIAAAQAQKHITHNEALEALDTIVQLSVLDRDLATPPATPAEGDSYIVAAAATGDWAGHEGEIASFRNGGWAFHAPRPGWLAHVADENIFVFHDGTQWVELSAAIAALQNLLKLGVNTTADDTNRLAVKSDAVLFSHDDASGTGSGDMRLKFNKAASANTASLLFQSNWSGRAEIGLAGDDDLRVKVSSDGLSWHTPLHVRAADGRVAMVEGAVYVGSPTRERNSGNAQAYVEMGGGGGSWICNVQDGTGRVNYRWNASSGPSPRFLTSGDRAVEWDIDGNGSFGLSVKVSGANTGAGTPVSFTTLFSVGTRGVRAMVPLQLPSHAVANLPSASVSGPGALIYVSNESGGPTLAFSDGSNWRRVQDRAIVS